MALPVHAPVEPSAVVGVPVRENALVLHELADVRVGRPIKSAWRARLAGLVVLWADVPELALHLPVHGVILAVHVVVREAHGLLARAVAGAHLLADGQPRWEAVRVPGGLGHRLAHLLEQHGSWPRALPLAPCRRS